MSRAKRQARRASRKAARVTKREIKKVGGSRKQAIAAAKSIRKDGRKGIMPGTKKPLPAVKKSLADLTKNKSIKTPAGGPKLNDIAEGGGDLVMSDALKVAAIASLSDINPLTPSAISSGGSIGGGMGTGGGFPGMGAPELGGGFVPSGDFQARPEPEETEEVEAEEVEAEEVEEIEEGEPQGDEDQYDSIIGGILEGAGKAVGGILSGLNINTGAKKKAKTEALVNAYNAKTAAIAAQQPKKQDHTMLYIGIGLSIVVVIVIAFVMLKKKK